MYGMVWLNMFIKMHLRLMGLNRENQIIRPKLGMINMYIKIHAFRAFAIVH